MEERLLKVLEEKLLGLQRDEAQCMEALEKISGKYNTENSKLVKTEEQLEYENDLAKIRKEIEATKKEDAYIKKLLQERQEKLGIILTEKSLLRDKEQLEQAIKEMSGKSVLRNGKLEKTPEQIEYENDLLKVEEELKKIDKIKGRIKRIEAKLKEAMDKYKIEPEKETEATEKETKSAPEKKDTESKSEELGDKHAEEPKKEAPKVKEETIEDLLGREQNLKHEIETAEQDLKRAKDEGNINDIDSYSEWLEALKEELRNVIDRRKKLEELNLGKSEERDERDKIRDEIAYLESLLDDPDLDPSDMPDINRQDILDRIAKLKEKLGRDEEKDSQDKGKGDDFQPPAVVPGRDKFQPPVVVPGKDKFQPPVVKPRKDKFQPPAVIPGKDKFQPPAVIPGKDKFQPPAVVPPKELDIRRTGLQVFREQFNQMPEIRRRHTFSENPLLPLPGSLALALATAGVIAGPVAWAGAAGVAVASYVGAKPILRRITGQSRIEREITQQFNDMDIDDLKLMADYLTEETIIDLKPNAVILRALNRSLRGLADRENGNLMNEINAAQSERNQLLQRSSLSEDDRERLDELSRLIDEHRREIDDNELRSKNARRGRERVSAQYKGNMRGSRLLNIFHRRNSTTAEYSQAINDYADAEYEGLRAEATNDSVEYARAQLRMEQVGQNNTYTNALGLLRSPFNMRRSQVRVVSDTRDNTVRNIGVMAMAAASLHRTMESMGKLSDELKRAKAVEQDIVNRHNSEAVQAENVVNAFNQSKDKMNGALGGITDQHIQGTANTAVIDTANAGEVGAMREFGTVNHANEGYVNADQHVQTIINSLKDKSNGAVGGQGSLADKLDRLAGLYSSQETTSTMQNLQNVTKGASAMTQAGVDHTAGFNVIGNAQVSNSFRADLYRKMASVVREAQSMSQMNLPAFSKFTTVLQDIKADFIGPIAAAATSLVSSIGVDIKRNHDKQMDSEGR